MRTNGIDESFTEIREDKIRLARITTDEVRIGRDEMTVSSVQILEMIRDGLSFFLQLRRELTEDR